jgi:hypothetical protein
VPLALREGERDSAQSAQATLIAQDDTHVFRIDDESKIELPRTESRRTHDVREVIRHSARVVTSLLVCGTPRAKAGATF